MGGRGGSGGSGGGGKTIKLTGTEKQIAWAKQIIADSQSTIDKNIARIEKVLGEIGWGPKSGMGKELATWHKIKESYEKALNEIEKKPNNAAFIIDNRRSLDSGYIVRLL